MSLLELDHVSKRYKHGTRQRTALQDVTLELYEGELVGIWGLRGSGRSTLLRIAAGIEPPDEGSIRLNGRELSTHPNALGEKIGYCHPALASPAALRRGASTAPVPVGLIAAQLARGVPADAARTRALQALERTGAQHCTKLSIGDLDHAEAVRVTIAQALTANPSLLVIDQPTKRVDLLQRDPILRLLRSLADEGIAILMSVEDSTGLLGANRALSLEEGQLRGPASRELAPVVALRLRASAQGRERPTGAGDRAHR